MKKRLFSILTVFGIGLSFCNADGIYHNPSLGLISVVYNSNTVYTLSDKNLGATCTDISQSCSYGDLFQWGNNYNFSSDVNDSYTLDTTPSGLSSYGPGNYFNSNGIFYTNIYTSNYNLWGGEDRTYSSMQGPCPSGFYIPYSWSDFVSIVSSLGLDVSDGADFFQYLLFSLPGYRRPSDGTLIRQGERGNYSSTYGYQLSLTDSLFVSSAELNPLSSDSMSYGSSVRCFKSSVVNPDFTWEKLYGDTISQPSSIDVLYNNGNSSITVMCNGDNIIQIDGLSTITATNKWTPYFNIDYRDEDNQSLIESYSKDILYLSGSLFKKTYTGNNERILTSQSSNNNSSFTGFVPTFDVVFTGEAWEDTGNVFNNFAQNSLQVALSNVPSYIQYVIIIILLFFILGLVRRKKRR